MTTEIDWPFPVVASEERTEQQAKEISFLEAAHAGGFSAFTFLAGSFGAEAKNGRRGEIIHRGGNRVWELILSTHDDEVASAKVSNFSQAAAAVLDWLRGDRVLEVRIASDGRSVVQAPATLDS
ncbi:MAG: hypothetical protein ACC645_02245 [Pirellulales bacterium]